MPIVNNGAVTRVVGINAVLAVAYAAAGWLGLQVPYYGQYVTLFWAPTAGESGGPKVIDPPAPGYGLQLIEGIVDHQLGGRVVLAFREEGLRCTLHIPSA